MHSRRVRLAWIFTVGKGFDSYIRYTSHDQTQSPVLKHPFVYGSPAVKDVLDSMDCIAATNHDHLEMFCRDFRFQRFNVGHFREPFEARMYQDNCVRTPCASARSPSACSRLSSCGRDISESGGAIVDRITVLPSKSPCLTSKEIGGERNIVDWASHIRIARRQGEQCLPRIWNEGGGREPAFEISMGRLALA